MIQFGVFFLRQERFGWLLDHIRQVLAEAVAPDPVEWILGLALPAILSDIS